ncbi:hypothetical protein pgond44_14458 [Psychroflexus gondwanensis ACAM 44]|jgi:hypothetical protein|uniref:Uncharacterized protein n=1 Tax=Psychroflexus gondwanensis ACAM 44 TaxID=1189619 RepID=N1WLT1_9FLAO|nr:hypothetical protein [Psychroflexus gondwanensis]EMY79925.1 hypothetical protein pgond44_14458 [Psychroflexus gondwanensis ACAM 44]
MRNLLKRSSHLSKEEKQKIFDSFCINLCKETDEKLIQLYNSEVEAFEVNSLLHIYLAALAAIIELRKLDKKEILKNRKSLFQYVVFIKGDKLCFIDDLTLNEVEALVYRFVFGKINDTIDKTPSVVHYDKEWIIYKEHKSFGIVKTKTNFLIRSIIKGNVLDDFHFKK